MKQVAVLTCISFLLALSTASAAQMDGVTFPNEVDVGGKRLVLNGLALRTYSLLRIHIYVAALYLEHRSSDAAAIMDSPEDKVLMFRFSRDIGADAARKSWRETFDENCPAPCKFYPEPITRFLANVPAVHEGDLSTLVFTKRALEISMNGHPLGEITDPNFARLVLATFIGARPTAPAVKLEMLGEKG